MENKTLQDFLNEANEDYKKVMLRDFGDKATVLIETSKDTFNLHPLILDICEQYASHVAEQACRKQRELCAEHAGIKILWAHHLIKAFPELEVNINRIIASDSILNAPLATERN